MDVSTFFHSQRYERDEYTDGNMKTGTPTSQEIEELVSYLPLLYAEGFTPIKQWCGGKSDKGDYIIMPWPEYDEIVEKFFRVLTQECWTDPGYRLQDAGRMLMDHDVIKVADLDQIKTMLTFCVRGEHFCDGSWGATIEDGRIRRLLERLAELVSNST